jgi:Ca2+-binding RTX toxin-like protein
MEEDFLMANPGPGTAPGSEEPNEIIGTSAADRLVGTMDDDLISGLAGNDTLYGLSGADTLDGGAGLDLLYGGMGEDAFVFAEGTGLDIVYDFEDGTDMIQLSGMTFEEVTISSFSTLGTQIAFGADRMILLDVDSTSITEADFLPDNTLSLA